MISDTNIDHQDMLMAQGAFDGDDTQWQNEYEAYLDALEEEYWERRLMEMGCVDA